MSDRFDAGIELQTMLQTGQIDLEDPPDTEEEWQLWVKANKLAKTAGMGDEFQGAYEEARGAYRDTVYAEVFEPAGWTREQFDEVREMFKDTPAASEFRTGALGTDFERLKDLGPQAKASDDYAEFVARSDMAEAEDTFDKVQTPDLQEFDPAKMRVGEKMDLQGFDLADAGESAWADNADLGFGIEHFKNIARGGEDAQANAEWNKRKNEAQQLARANREASQRALEVQGMGGSGMELLSDLEGQGQMTQSLFNAGVDVAGMEQARRDAAAGDVFTMAGDVASNTDVWNQWSTNREDVEAMADAEIANEVERDITARERFVGDSNTAIENDARLYSLDIPQREFGNEMILAGAQAGQDVTMGQFGGQYDQFGDEMDWEKYKYKDSKPGVLEKVMTGLGATAGALTGAGRIYQGFKR